VVAVFLVPEAPEEIQVITFQIGMLGKYGLDINDP
jgi:hypothetical protein